MHAAVKRSESAEGLADGCRGVMGSEMHTQLNWSLHDDETIAPRKWCPGERSESRPMKRQLPERQSHRNQASVVLMETQMMVIPLSQRRVGENA